MKPELLAPAGTMECLVTALDFGADAVYTAGRSFGLRASAPNLSPAELREGVRLAHAQDRRIYVAVNALIREDELPALREYLALLADIGPDALIFSDPAVAQLSREMGVGSALHLSTQASTMNSAACKFWGANGVNRVVLGREATLDEIAHMRSVLPGDMELEVFVHGAMCIAHSGRCLLSSIAAGRSGNRGECAQPCRWEYEIREKGAEGEWMTIAEDEAGTYILNSRDLMMLDKIPELVSAGVTSLKIEGRMKSPYYVASVVSAYRAAVDLYCADGQRASAPMMEELAKSATRAYTRGFFFGNPGPDGQDTVRKDTPRRYTFAARVLGPDEREGYIRVEQRNKFSVGETLEILAPDRECRSFPVEEIVAQDGTHRSSAPHAQELVALRCPHAVQGGEILRRLDD